jgi:glycerol-3-phosphate dehydrogenase (NAD(P)+)
MQKILIIGGGRLGSALKKVLVKSKPIIWDINPKISESKLSLETETKNSDLIFICTPTNALEKILTQIKPTLKTNSIVISFSKGLSNDGKFTFEILKSILNDSIAAKQNYGIMAGPLMAEELNQNLPTVATLALKNNNQFLTVKKLFLESPIHLINSSDLKGLAVAGTLKNVYALFLGVIDELKLGDNIKAVFLSKSFREIKIIGQNFGAKLTTLNSSAGLADLIVTAYDPNSRDAACGHAIIKNEKCDSEGYRTLPLLIKRLKNQTNLPILNTLTKIIKEPKNVRTIIQNLLPR